MSTEKLAKILEDGRTPWFSVHSVFDEIPWSPEAYRVYGHLCRRAGQKITAFPSYASIGKTCFGKAIADGKLSEQSARRKAMRVVQELIDLGLLKRETRRDSEKKHESNLYTLTHTCDWKFLTVVTSHHHPGDVTSPGVVTSHHQGGDITSPKGIPSKAFQYEGERETPLPPSQGEVDCSNSLALPAASELGVSTASVKGAKSETKKGLRAKGPTSSTFEDFREAYNRDRPQHWPEMQLVNSKRQGVFNQLIKDLGGRPRAIEAMSNALNFAKTKDWYQARSLTFENFASNNKIIQLSENFSGPPDLGLPDVQAAIGQENLRTNSLGYMAPEWRLRFGKPCVSDLTLDEAREYLAGLRLLPTVEVAHAN